MKYQLYLGDCIDVMKSLPSNFVHSIVCDPPYGLSSHSQDDIIECLTAWIAGQEYKPKGKKGFMGHSWDAWPPGPEAWRECLRILKPGGHLLAFAGTRSMDLMSMAIRLAGFELRDSIGYASEDGGRAPLLAWCYGSGFPKSLDISKAIDKDFGAAREVIGQKFADRYPNGPGGNTFCVGGKPDDSRTADRMVETAPATDEAKRWSGYGTQLKPAWEPILLARKPLEGTVAKNVLSHEGCGGLNIDGCRIETTENLNGGAYSNGKKDARNATSYVTGVNAGTYQQPSGRFPANVIHDGSDAVLEGFPDSDGRGSGSASRFFYCAKASKRDRDEGLDGFERKKTNFAKGTGLKNNGDGTLRNQSFSIRNSHPTVKPTALMRYLCRLVTPSDGIVLDPFTGSGSTGKAAVLEGFRFIGIEAVEEYHAIADRRCHQAEDDWAAALWNF